MTAGLIRLPLALAEGLGEMKNPINSFYPNIKPTSLEEFLENSE